MDNINENKTAEIVDKEMWDHYSELPNPAWYEYKNNNMKKWNFCITNCLNLF